MITIDFNETAWSRQLAEHVAMARISTAGAVTSAARMWLRAAVRLTVPSGPGAALNKTSNQKKLGEGLVVMDVSRLFIDWNETRKTLKNQSLAKAVDELSKSGSLESIRTMLSGFNLKGVVRQPSHELHKQSRGKRGHVASKSRKYLVLNEGAIRAYQSKALGQVGIAKSGWKRAAGPLRVKLPAWVMRHDGRGHFKGIVDRDKPTIEFGNAVGFANKNAREDAVMQHSGAFAQRQMAKMLTIYFKALQSGNGSALRAKVQKDTFEAMEA